MSDTTSDGYIPTPQLRWRVRTMKRDGKEYQMQVLEQKHIDPARPYKPQWRPIPTYRDDVDQNKGLDS